MWSDESSFLVIQLYYSIYYTDPLKIETLDNINIQGEVTKQAILNVFIFLLKELTLILNGT